MYVQQAMKEIGVTFRETQKILAKNLGSVPSQRVPFGDNAPGFFLDGFWDSAIANTNYRLGTHLLEVTLPRIIHTH